MAATVSSGQQSPQDATFQDEKRAHINVRETTSSEGDVESGEEVHWQTGVRARFPWVGFAAIIVIFVGITMTGVVLGTSNHKSKEEWPAYGNMEWKNQSWKERAQVQPHVMLAVINTITNICLAIAIGHGVAIAWWRRAMRGSTVEDLHRSWGFASSMFELLTAGRYFNMIALAALTAKFALVDNVLLQQAAETYPAWYMQNNTVVKLPIVGNMPPGYAGFIADNGQLSYSYPFSVDTYQFNVDKLLKVDELYRNGTVDGEYTWDFDTQCRGICYVNYRGFGLDWDCTDAIESAPYEITIDSAIESASTNTTLDAFFNTTLHNNPLFSIAARFVEANQSVGSAEWVIPPPSDIAERVYDYGSIALQMKWASLVADDPNAEFETCTGKTLYRYCSLRPATLMYPIKIVNTTNLAKGKIGADMENGITAWRNWNATAEKNITFSDDAPFRNQWDGIEIVDRLWTHYNPSDSDANLAIIADFIDTYYGSYVALDGINDTVSNSRYYLANYRAGQNLGIGGGSFGTRWLGIDAGPSCETEVDNPGYVIGTDLNNLLLRSSMAAATHYRDASDDEVYFPDPKHIQTCSRFMWISSVFYKTNWWFGGAAMINVFLCVLFVLPSYWGFWQLGRKVTLGPMEVASAFQAPILDHPTVVARGEVDQLVKEIGNRPIRYGQVEGQHRLGVAEPSGIKPLS